MLGQFCELEIVFFWFGPEFDAFDLSVNCFRQVVCKLIGIKSNFGALILGLPRLYIQLSIRFSFVAELKLVLS